MSPIAAQRSARNCIAGAKTRYSFRCSKLTSSTPSGTLRASSTKLQLQTEKRSGTSMGEKDHAGEPKATIPHWDDLSLKQPSMPTQSQNRSGSRESPPTNQATTATNIVCTQEKTF